MIALVVVATCFVVCIVLLSVTTLRVYPCNRPFGSVGSCHTSSDEVDDSTVTDSIAGQLGTSKSKVMLACMTIITTAETFVIPSCFVLKSIPRLNLLIPATEEALTYTR